MTPFDLWFIVECMTISADEARLTKTVAKHFLATQKPVTAKEYKRDLQRYFRWCLKNDIAPLRAKRADVEEYKQYLIKLELMPASVGRYLTSITGFYNLAEADEVIPRNPARYVKKPHRDRDSRTLGLTYLEFADLMRVSKRTGPNEHALVLLMGMLGLRVSEACAVRGEDFYQERGHQVLRVVGKGDKPAVLPLPPIIYRDLKPLIDLRGTGPLVRGGWNNPANRAYARRVLKKLALEAGINKAISPHSLRHTFITQLLDSGAPLRDVQIAARHASPDMTVRYDRNRHLLDRHANYQLASRMAGAVADN